MKSILLLIKKFNNLTGIISGLLIFGICLLIGFEAVSRNLFNMPTRWSIVISQFLLIYAIFLGSAYCFQQEGHIRIELIIDKMSSKMRKIFIVAGLILANVYILVIISRSFGLTSKAFSGGWLTTTTIQIPEFYIYGIIMLGSVLMLLATIVKIVETIKEKELEQND